MKNICRLLILVLISSSAYSADTPISGFPLIPGSSIDSGAYYPFVPGSGGSNDRSLLSDIPNIPSVAAVFGTKAPLASPTFTGAVTAPSFVGPLTGNVTGNASTATALVASPSPCPSGDAAQGVDSSGNALGCFAPSTSTGTVQSVSVVSANGLGGTVANPTTNPAVTLTTSVTGIAKGNGTSLSAATAGTDYALPNANTTGTAANITATTNSTLTTISSLALPYSQLSGTVPTWNQSTTGNAATATALATIPTPCASGQATIGVNASGNSLGCFTPATGTGTVTSVSVASANGFSGTVANPTASPTVTITTTINAPVLAGNGTAVSAATTTGTGSTVVLATSPTLVAPALGTPSSGVATNLTGLPLTTGVTGILPNANTTAQSGVGANTIMLRDSGSNVLVNDVTKGFNQFTTSGGTLTLTIGSNPVQQATGTATETIVLPDATTLSIGKEYTVINNSTQIVTVEDGGTNVISNINPTGSVSFFTSNVGNATGAWAQIVNTPYANIQQALDWGSLSLAGTAAGSNGCSFNATGTSNENSFSSLGTGSSCNAWTASGSLTAPATNSISIPLGNTLPGKYEVHISGPIITYLSGSISICNWQLLDPDGGTSAMGQGNNQVSGLQGSSTNLFGTFTWTKEESRTLTIQAAGSAGNVCSISPNVAGRNVQITVDYFPSQPQQVINANTNLQPTYSVVTQTTHSGGFSANGSGTYTPPQGVTRIEFEMAGGGGSGANSGTSGFAAGNNGGDTTLGSQLDAGGGFGGNPGGALGPVGGGAANCGTITTCEAFGGGTGGGAGFSQVGDYSWGGRGGETPYWGGAGPGGSAAQVGTNAVADTGGGGGGAPTGVTVNTYGGGGGSSGGFLKGYLAFPGSLSYSVGAGGGAVAGGANGFGSGNGAGGKIIIKEIYGFNAPIINNSITTTAAGAWRVESEIVTAVSSSSCTFSGGTSFIASSTPSATAGNCTVTFTTPFSGAPVCTANNTNTTLGILFVPGTYVSATATTATIQNNYYTGSGVNGSGDPVSISCQGPR